MGRPKAALEWHGSTLLHRTAAVLGRAVAGPVVVVRAPGQELPELPAGVEMVEDPVEGLGPDAGGRRRARRRAGARPARLRLLHGPAVPAPGVRPAGAARARRPDVDLVLPTVRGFRQPLAAGYRDRADAADRGAARRRATCGPGCCSSTAPRPARRRRAAGRPRAGRVDPRWTRCRTSTRPRTTTPPGPGPAPDVLVHCFGALAGAAAAVRDGAARRRSGAAAAAVRLALDRHVVAALNGDQIARDPLLPLVAGDTVAFLSADAGG